MPQTMILQPYRRFLWAFLTPYIQETVKVIKQTNSLFMVSVIIYKFNWAAIASMHCYVHGKPFPVTMQLGKWGCSPYLHLPPFEKISFFLIDQQLKKKPDYLPCQ